MDDAVSDLEHVVLGPNRYDYTNSKRTVLQLFNKIITKSYNQIHSQLRLYRANAFEQNFNNN